MKSIATPITLLLGLSQSQICIGMIVRFLTREMLARIFIPSAALKPGQVASNPTVVTMHFEAVQLTNHLRIEKARSMPQVRLNSRQLSDVELIAIGAFSPLTGFMGQKDYENVVDNQRLANDLPWTIPVTLAVSDEDAERVKTSTDIALTGENSQVVAILHLTEIYSYDREHEANLVLKTTSDKHPGVRYLSSVGSKCLAGQISLLRRPDRGEFTNYLLDPKETRFLFEHRGWQTVVAFQTRNPVHRAHEYILKCALETVDGLLLHPLVG